MLSKQCKLWSAVNKWPDIINVEFTFSINIVFPADINAQILLLLNLVGVLEEYFRLGAWHPRRILAKAW